VHYAVRNGRGRSLPTHYTATGHRVIRQRQCIPVLRQHLYNLSNSFKLGVWYMTQSCTEKQHFTFLYSLSPQWVELPPPADPTDQGAKCAALIFFSGGGPPVSMPQIFGTSYAHTQCEKKNNHISYGDLTRCEESGSFCSLLLLGITAEILLAVCV